MKRIEKGNRTLGSLPHPKDRKVGQFQKQQRRAAKISAQKDALSSKQNLVVFRFLWFREQVQYLLDNGLLQVPLLPSDLSILLRLYLSRNDAEVAVLKSFRNPPAGRIKQLCAVKQVEEDQFQSTKGLLVPNLLTDAGVHALVSNWDGSLRLAGRLPSISCCSKQFPSPVQGEYDRIASALKPAEEVHEAHVSTNGATRRIKRFVKEGQRAARLDDRRRSVKATKSNVEVAREGKQRRVHKAQTKAKHRRAVAVAASRQLHSSE